MVAGREKFEEKAAEGGREAAGRQQRGDREERWRKEGVEKGKASRICK